MNARIALEPGYILHRRPYRDTSLLLEAFTPERGRAGLVAKGARRGRSPLQGLLQPFRPLLLSWSGRGELATLTGAEADGRPLVLAGADLISGFYLNELLLRLLPRDDPLPEAYQAYSGTLAALAAGGGEWTLRLFERDLLDALGYGLLLTEQADNGAPVQSDRRYCYHLELGPQPAAAHCPGVEVGGEALLALAAGERPSPPALADAKRLMRAALALYLGPRPLATRELFRNAYSRAATPAARQPDNND